MEWNTFCFICFHTEIVTNVKISKISIHLSHITWPLRVFKIPILYAFNIDVWDLEITELVYMRISDRFNSHFSSPRNNSQWRQWIQIRFMVCKSAMPASLLIQTAFTFKPTIYLTISYDHGKFVISKGWSEEEKKTIAKK